MSGAIHPAAGAHLPIFVTPPGQTDVLFVVAVGTVVGGILIVGNLLLRLHALPERMAHRTNKVQIQVVAVLCLLSLLTHQHVFWIAALLLALVELPDVTGPIGRIDRSLSRLADRDDGGASSREPGA